MASSRQKRSPGANESDELRALDWSGLKFFDQIRPLLDSLHEIGSDCDKAGNRDLYLDQYCLLVLMWMFNPILTPLRSLQQAGTLTDARKKFGVGRASLGSLSESVSIFETEPLKEIAAPPNSSCSSSWSNN